MLFKSINSLRGQAAFLLNTTQMTIGVRNFSSGAKISQSGANFHFPKHNEFFNDEYYDNED